MFSKIWSSLVYYAACLCLFTIALILTLPNRPLMHSAFTYGSYYFILGMCLLWAYSLASLYYSQGGSVVHFLKKHWKGILASFLLASLIFISVPKYFRVLNDETNLLSVSKSMTFNKDVENRTEGRYYYYIFWPSETTGTEKRPFLFPFFTSLLHTFLGYRIENAFILNYFSLWAMLFLLYLCMQSSLDFIYILGGMFLVLSQPFICLSATSACFEIFNFTFILASFLALKKFLKDPSAPMFTTLAMTLLMLGNIRYESILFFGLTMLLLLCTGSIKLEYFFDSWTLGLIPLLLLPLIWQRILLIHEADPNLVQGSWLHAFSFQNAHQNIVLFINFVSSLDGRLGYAGVVNILGAVAAVVLFILTLKKKRPFDRRRLVIWSSVGLCLFVLFNLVLFYQGGINDHPLNGRFYIPILAPLSLIPIYLTASLFKRSKKAAVITLLFSLGVFTFYHPVAVKDELCSTLVIIREYRYVSEFLKTHAEKDSLVIWGTPGQLIVSDIGAISYQTANNDAVNILQQMKNHLYNKVFVIQSVSYRTKQPFDDNRLDEGYKLQTIEEHQISGEFYFRISLATPG